MDCFPGTVGPYQVFIMCACHILLWGLAHWGQDCLTVPGGVGHRYKCGGDTCQKIEIQNNNIKSTCITKAELGQQTDKCLRKTEWIVTPGSSERVQMQRAAVSAVMKEGFAGCPKGKTMRWVLSLLIIGSITAVISSLPVLVLLLIHYFKKRVELYFMSFEYTKSPRSSKVWTSRCGMLFRREVAKTQLDVSTNPPEDRMEGALLSRLSRRESVASWEASG